MSSARAPEQLVPTTGMKRKQFSDQDQDDLDQLDRAFKRIKDAVPRAPYILSTPSLHPYQYHSAHEARAWMLGRLFKPEEEAGQYRTYLFREPYQDCFVLQPGEEDEPQPPRPNPLAVTAASQAPKKKISLSDYKSKQANGVITPGSKKQSPALPPTKPSSLQTNGTKPAETQSKPSSALKEEGSLSQKKSLHDDVAPNKRESQDSKLAVRPAHSQKNTSQKDTSTESKINIDTSGPTNSTPHGLPPLLSPVEPPLSNPYGLPAILSPTLPANIQAELEKSELQRKRAHSNASTSSSDRKSQLLHVPEATAGKRPVAIRDGESSKIVPRERSVSLNGNPPHVRSPAQQEESESKLVVRLKYTKKSRETIKRLLALPPKRDGHAEKKEREEQSKSRTVPAQAKGSDVSAQKLKPIPKVAARRPDASASASKAPTPATKTAEKRPRANDDDAQATPAKRPRASTLDRPITPKDQVLSPTATSNRSSVHKAQGNLITPRKDLKAVNMLRTTSAESHDSTPGRSGTTPVGFKHDGKAPTSVPPLGAKKVDVSLLQHLSKTLNQQGRSLKHEGQKLEREKAGKMTKADQKQAAVIGLECILSYMAAYYAQDQSLQLQGRPTGVELTWKTLLPLCSSYGRLTKDFQHLDGFRSYLGAVIAATICALVAPRAANPKAHDSPHELSVAELTKQHTQLTENLGLLADHYTKHSRHASDARVALPMAILEKTYSKTFAGAETDTKLAKVPEKVNAARLHQGPYFLPIGSDTTPIQAVRFGLAFLGEYCERERIDHKLKVNLNSRPE